MTSTMWIDEGDNWMATPNAAISQFSVRTGFRGQNSANAACGYVLRSGCSQSAGRPFGAMSRMTNVTLWDSST
jgi:hypothetical protein